MLNLIFLAWITLLFSLAFLAPSIPDHLVNPSLWPRHSPEARRILDVVLSVGPQPPSSVGYTRREETPAI